MQRVLVVGDIHGHYDELLEVLDKAEFNPNKDLLIFLGDYIDRGPDSFKVVQHIKRLKRDYPDNVIALRGNHEQMAIDAVRSPSNNLYAYRNNFMVWINNGGDETLSSYAINNATIDDEVEFFDSLPFVYELTNYIFVHGGLNPTQPLYQQSKHDMLWIRDVWINSEPIFGKTVIYGHTPTYDGNPCYSYGKIGIDTGVFFTGILTCLELPSGKIYQTI